MTKKILNYREYYKKNFGKKTALEIRFGWIDYARKHGLNNRKTVKGGDETIIAYLDESGEVKYGKF
jgi:hypothetical protein